MQHIPEHVSGLGGERTAESRVTHKAGNRRWIRSLAMLTAITLLTCTGLAASAKSLVEQQRLVDRATRTVQRFAADRSLTWFRDKAQHALGIFVVPTVIRGAFIIGATAGDGILVARPDLTAPWSEPAFYKLGGASFGFQIGGDASELVLVIMTERGLESFYKSSLKLGGDASIAAGSDGSGVGGGTSPTLTADIISYGNSKGGYMGISLGGAVVNADHDGNKAYYGFDVQPIDILAKGRVRNTGSAGLRAAVTKATQPPENKAAR